MKKQFFAFLILFLLAFSVTAQIEDARKIDEYGATNCDDYQGRLDNLLTELNKFSDAKGYVFVYEGNSEMRFYNKKGRYKGNKIVLSISGEGKELLDYYKNHLLFRNFPLERIVFVEAGFREEFATELWLVPKNINPPVPTPTLKKIRQRKVKTNQFGFCGEM